MPDQDARTRPTPTRPRRWLRRIGWLLAALAILLAGGWFLHPRLLRPIVAQALSDALDAEVQVGAARLTPSGQVHVEQVRTTGEAPFDLLREARADVGWGRLIRGDLRPRRVTLEGMTLPVSGLVSDERREPALSLKALADEPALSRLERLVIEQASVVLAGDGQRIVFDAQADLQDQPGRYDVKIIAGGAAVGGEPQSFTGVVDLPDGVARIRGADIPLRPWLAMVGAPAGEASAALRSGTLTSFTLAHRDGAELRFKGAVADVALVPPGLEGGGEPPPVQAIHGDFVYSASGFSADLKGELEGAPVSLTLDGGEDFWTSGLGLRAEVSGLAVGPDSVAYAILPDRVREEVADFSDPTGVIDGSAEGRVTPATGAVSIAGRLLLTDAQAAYTDFPYPFQGITAEIEFDDTRLAIRNLRGRSSTGATIRGQATVTPLTDDASVQVDLTVESLRLDDSVRQAMSPQQREMLRTLFHPEPSEFLSDPAAPPAVRQSEFSVGGVARVNIAVARGEGPQARYRTNVEAVFQEAGLLAERFPYPLTADNLRLEIDDQAVSAASDRISGLTGARGRLSARVDLREDGGELAPTMEIEMSSLPMDATLFWAMARTERTGAAGVGPELRRTLERLGLGGAIACTVRAGPRQAGDQEIVIDADLEGLAMSPAPFDAPDAQPRLRLSDFSGKLRVTSDGWRLGPVTAAIDSGTVRFQTSGAASGPDQALLLARSQFDAQDVDLALPVEDLIAVFAPEVAQMVADARRSFDPSGPVDAAGTIDAGPAGLRTAEVVLTLNGLAELDALGGRVGLDGESGQVTITHQEIRLEQLAGAGAFNQTTVGDVVLDGAIDYAGDGDLRVELRRGALDSAAAPAILERIAGAEAAARYRRANVQGSVDGSARLMFDQGDVGLQRVAIRPREFAFTRSGARVEVTKAEGELAYDDGEGAVRELSLTSPAWSARVDGDWSLDEGISADLSVSAIGDGLDPSLTALLPAAASAALATLDVRTPGGFTLQDGRLVIASRPGDDGAPSIDRLSFDGLVWTAAAALDVGLPIEEAAGEATVRYRFNRDSERRLEIDLDFERMTIAGAAAEHVAGRLQAPAESGRAALRLDGESSQGRWTADGGFATDGSGRFDVEVRLAGLDLSTLTQIAETEAPPEDASSDAEVEGAGSRVDGYVAVAGRAGDAASIRGRGSVRVTGGGVLRLPVAAQVLEIAALQPPTGEELDFAESRFFIDGRRVVFESLLATSRSIAMLGEGSMTWPNLGLDLRFRTRGNLRAPFVSDVIDALRDELLTAQVSGTLMEPEVRLVQLSATRRLFGEMLNGRRTPTMATKVAEGAAAEVQPEPRE